jgi:hypothetical protein
MVGMTDERVRVSRSLYRSALVDAIDWTESLIEAGGADPEDDKRLANYRRALAAISGPKKAEPEPAYVSITELRQRGPGR